VTRRLPRSVPHPPLVAGPPRFCHWSFARPQINSCSTEEVRLRSPPVVVQRPRRRGTERRRRMVGACLPRGWPPSARERRPRPGAPPYTVVEGRHWPVEYRSLAGRARKLQRWSCSIQVCRTAPRCGLLLLSRSPRSVLVGRARAARQPPHQPAYGHAARPLPCLSSPTAVGEGRPPALLLARRSASSSSLARSRPSTSLRRMPSRSLSPPKHFCFTLCLPCWRRFRNA
jgi:hypothetical protein